MRGRLESKDASGGGVNGLIVEDGDAAEAEGLLEVGATEERELNGVGGIERRGTHLARLANWSDVFRNEREEDVQRGGGGRQRQPPSPAPPRMTGIRTNEAAGGLPGRRRRGGSSSQEARLRMRGGFGVAATGETRVSGSAADR